MDKLFVHYTEVYGGDEDKSIRRICEHFDIYFDQSLLNASRKITKDRSRIHTYISRANLTQYKNKTYDTTLDLERNKVATVSSLEDIEDIKDYTITPKIIKFWGLDYKPQDYQTLQGYYEELLKLCDGKPDIKKQKMMKNLCLLEFQMQQNIQTGKDIGTLSNSYKSIFEASGLKNDEVDTDKDTYGIWLSMVEKYTPADYYKDKGKYRDFFGLGEYIERFMYRPLKNLLTGSKEKEKEFWINDEKESGE